MYFMLSQVETKQVNEEIRTLYSILNFDAFKSLQNN